MPFLADYFFYGFYKHLQTFLNARGKGLSGFPADKVCKCAHVAGFFAASAFCCAAGRRFVDLFDQFVEQVFIFIVRWRDFIFAEACFDDAGDIARAAKAAREDFPDVVERTKNLSTGSEPGGTCENARQQGVDRLGFVGVGIGQKLLH